MEIDDSNVTPPRGVLSTCVSRYAAYHGLAPNRVQRWISFMVLGAALSRIEHEEKGPTFLVKGGVSLEVRLRMRARATKDFDNVYRGERDKLLRLEIEANGGTPPTVTRPRPRAFYP